jgi:ferredoxin, 2Fe-2S
MPKIHILPTGQVIDAQEGETVLEAALRQGVHIQHACGGFCACTTCHCLVEPLKDLCFLSEMDDEEADRLERVSGGVLPNSRLACQAKVLGDVQIRVLNFEHH